MNETREKTQRLSNENKKTLYSISDTTKPSVDLNYTN
jgi:hypothetical protein